MSKKKTPSEKFYKSLSVEGQAHCDAMDDETRTAFLEAGIAAAKEAKALAAAQKIYDALSDEDKVKCDALEGDARAEFLAAAKPPSAKSVEVRVLSKCHYGKCNQVVSIPEKELKAAEANGLVDSDSAAVKAGEKAKG